jgi:phosphoribosylamine---glycine ligase
MKILIIGGGGREHALGWSLARDPRVSRLHFAPGNAGTATLGDNHAAAAGDVPALVDLARTLRPDLVVVGPEIPLCAGLVDRLTEAGIPAFGPTADCARLEGSKIFCKDLLLAAGIPTAHSSRHTKLDDALRALDGAAYPLVVKADGLASGKGVVIAPDRATAADALRAMMRDRAFGDAGASVLLEEFLEGQEASLHALCDGTTFALLPTAQDHKRVGDGDRGPNTGGMGAYAPAPAVTPALREHIGATIFEPLLREFKTRGMDYRGVLYAGLMLTPAGPKVLEFNCRFGDPETQVLLPLLETPLLDLLLAVVHGRLAAAPPAFQSGAAITVVLAAPGYPAAPELGGPIGGLDTPLEAGQMLFHAGTARRGADTVTTGGRVLCATGTGPDLPAARARAYALAQQIRFPGMHYRRDIGHRALAP